MERVLYGEQRKSWEDLKIEEALVCHTSPLWVLHSIQSGKKTPDWGSVVEHADFAAVGRLHAPAHPGDQGGNYPFHGSHPTRVRHKGGLINGEKSHVRPRADGMDEGECLRK